MVGEPAATARAAAPAPAAAVAEHVAALSQDAAAMVRQEVDALRGELRSTIRKAAGASMLLGVAVACGALALGSSGVLVVRVLGGFAHPRLADVARSARAAPERSGGACGVVRESGDSGCGYCASPAGGRVVAGTVS